MTFLTPLGALAALAALLLVAAWTIGERRVRAVRRTLGLATPPRRSRRRHTAAVCGIAIAGLAAAQPALTHSEHQRVRTDAAVFFVIDTSRSMEASSTPTSPTRIRRAVAAAVTLRAAVPEVPAGVATLTDRVLPDLLPVPDVAGFDADVNRAVGIDDPPPATTAVRVTTYEPLARIASGDYFAPNVTRRVVVLLTDGESNPIDPDTIAAALSPTNGYRFLAVRFWNADESIYDADGKPEAAYHPDPLGRVILANLASATGGRSFEESDLAGAVRYLKRAVGSGPAKIEPGTTTSRTPLAPYVALAGMLVLGAALLPAGASRRLRQHGLES